MQVPPLRFHPNAQKSRAGDPGCAPVGMTHFVAQDCHPGALQNAGPSTSLGGVYREPSQKGRDDTFFLYRIILKINQSAASRIAAMPHTIKGILPCFSRHLLIVAFSL